MNKNRKNHGRVASTPVLSSVGLAVLATLMGGGAQAAETSVSAVAGNLTTVTATGHQTVQSAQHSTSNASSTASGQNIGIAVNSPQAGTTNTVTQNLAGASATGNTFSNSIDLSLTGGITEPPAEGAASLGVATNSGVISSSASGNTVALDLDGFSSGSASSTANTISASTTLNSGTSSIAGTVPNDYGSPVPGMANLNYSPIGSSSNALGNIVITSAQQGAGAGSSAVADGNVVSLELGSNGTNAVDSAPALDNNKISATLKGNAATSTAGIQAGSAPAFSGSAVVSNQQLNTSDGGTIHAAGNVGSIIGAAIGSSDAGTANTLQGALSVQGNGITSIAIGNESLGAAGTAGNRIVLGDGMSFAGSTGIAFSDSIAGGLSANVMADLAIFNSQGNVGVSLGSATVGAVISAGAQSMDGGAVAVSGNSVTSAATGNAASSAISSGRNGASFAGTAAIANQQGNFNADVSAITGVSLIGALTGQEDGTINASTVAVTDNRSAATGYGNSISQSLSLEANALPLGGTALLVGSQLPASNMAVGAAVAGNLQGSYSSAVSASNVGSIIGLSADSRGVGGDTVHSSTLTVSGNTQEAVGLSNSASSALSLTGTTAGSGAGVVSVQALDGNSPVWAELAGSTASLHAGTHVADSTLSLANNLQRAVGYGNSASNAMSVAVNSAEVLALGPLASMVNAASGVAVVGTGYGVLNTQSVLGDVSATASGITAPVNALTVLVEGSVRGSSVSNAGNAFVAAAYGNDAASAAKLVLGTGVTSAGSSSIANVTNLQAATGSEITATATGGTVVNTRIDGSVSASTVSTSGNPVQALAFGNRSAGNTLAVTGNTIDAASPTPLGGAVANGSMLLTEAAFSVQNAQTGSGAVTATQRDDLAGSAASVLSSIGGPVSGSTIAANDNTSTAAATSNSAGNGLSIAANGLSGSSALQNFQTTSASVNALIGQAGAAGSPGIPGGPFNYTVTGTMVFGTYDNVTDTWLVSTGTLNVNATGFSADQIAYLIGDGWTPAGPGIYQKNAAGMTLSPTRYGQLSPENGGGTTFVGIAAGIPATAGTANQGGVTAAVGGNVTGSLLSVNSNSTNGSAIGNSASNSMAISANAITAASGQAVATAGVLPAGTGAQGDNALSNMQQVTGESALMSDVHGTFAIDAAPGAAIAGSTLSVSDNSQRGTAVANTAVNSLSVAGTNLSATSALASQQSSTAAVAASSNLELYAPGAVSASSLDLSRNQSASLGVINDVTNALTVVAANVSPVGAAVNAQLVAGTAVGDHVLNNSQTATTSVSSTAATRLYNQDQAAAATTGLVDSAVAVTGNSTTAEASANRAANTVALNAAALQGANAGLANTQASSATVAATASTSATFQLEGSAPETAAALNSGITMDGNNTSALARGNVASNVLNVSAGSGYAALAAAPAGSALGGSTQATAAVLNTQANTGNVSAAGTGTYQVALNGVNAGMAPGATGGTVAITANTVAAQAYGNSVTNAISVTAPAAGRPTAAIGNYQTNSGTIVATATGVSYGIGISGATNGSALRTAGNQVTATAVGNSAASTIAAR